MTQIRKTPNAAVPPPEMLDALERLTKDETVYVYIISGRDQAALDKWLGHIKHLGLSAEHGCFSMSSTMHLCALLYDEL